ncbi:YDB1 [Enterospora canceri]|uniref:YDB1 n=1 Tax=Enterospora canceri TaxID=1081671 RepID=A0A1Y1S7L7_9MICR|nr:YDB1 [Enterospora canceri]
MKSKQKYVRKAKVVAVVLLYYILCVTMGFATKYFISENGYNFRYPIFKTGINNLVHFVCAVIYIEYNKKREHSRAVGKRYLLETLLCSFIGSIDSSISMYTLRQVELAFYTILKSATPIFIVLSGFVLGTESVNFSTLFSILLIAVGTYLVTVKPIPTASRDIYLLLSSAIISGFRWSLIQFIITRRNDDIFVAIRDLCLPTSIFLFAYTSWVHSYREIFSSEFFESVWSALLNSSLIFGMGIISFLILFCELWIVKETSVLFLSISAVVKELVIVGISILNGATCMTKLNYLGIAISIIGIIFYNTVKHTGTKYLN